MENYCDNFCAIDFNRDKNFAWYSDRSMNAFPMPVRWGEKIVNLFRQKEIEKACHYIDMAETLLKKKYLCMKLYDDGYECVRETIYAKGKEQARIYLSFMIKMFLKSKDFNEKVFGMQMDAEFSLQYR